MPARPDRPERPERPGTVKGRTVLTVFFGALVAFLAFVFWNGLTGGGTANTTGAGSAAAGSSTSAWGGASAASSADLAALDSAIAKAIADKKVRDELRRRILAGWAQSEDEETRTAAKAGRFVPRPNEEGRGIDPKYIQKVVREDFFPMAVKCYEELLQRRPDAGGRIEMEFTIVADDQLGGIVEDAGLGDGGTIWDEKMSTCIQESLTTLAFPPPVKDAVITVVYPIEFAPGDD